MWKQNKTLWSSTESSWSQRGFLQAKTIILFYTILAAQLSRADVRRTGYKDKKTGSSEVWTLCSGSTKWRKQNDLNSSHLSLAPLKKSRYVFVYFEHIAYCPFPCYSLPPHFPKGKPHRVTDVVTHLHLYVQNLERYMGLSRFPGNIFGLIAQNYAKPMKIFFHDWN